MSKARAKGASRSTAGLLGLAVVLGACSASATNRSDLVSSFRRKDVSGRQFTQAQAECAADATLRTLTKAEIKVVVSTTGVGGLSASSQARWGDAIKRCLTS